MSQIKPRTLFLVRKFFIFGMKKLESRGILGHSTLFIFVSLSRRNLNQGISQTSHRLKHQNIITSVVSATWIYFTFTSFSTRLTKQAKLPAFLSNAFLFCMLQAESIATLSFEDQQVLYFALRVYTVGQNHVNIKT